MFIMFRLQLYAFNWNVPEQLMTQLTLITALMKPNLAFQEIANEDSPAAGFLSYIVPLTLLVPPLCIWLGSGLFGWRTGADEAIFFDNTSRVIISFSYFFILSLGFSAPFFLLNGWELPMVPINL